MKKRLLTAVLFNGFLAIALASLSLYTGETSIFWLSFAYAVLSAFCLSIYWSVPHE